MEVILLILAAALTAGIVLMGGIVLCALLREEADEE